MCMDVYWQGAGHRSSFTSTAFTDDDEEEQEAERIARLVCKQFKCVVKCCVLCACEKSKNVVKYVLFGECVVDCS